MVAALKILQWSLRASAQHPGFWLAVAVALAAGPMLHLANPARFAPRAAGVQALFYELAFLFSLLGALLAIPRLRQLRLLTARRGTLQRWSFEVAVVVVHAIGLGILCAWTSWIEWPPGAAALGLALLVTALFWAAMLRAFASLGVPASGHAPMLLAIAALMAINITAVPMLPLARGALSSASGLSLFTPAALAADFASISSLFVVAWCCESPLALRS